MKYKELLDVISEHQRIKVMYWTHNRGKITTIEPMIKEFYVYDAEYLFLKEMNVHTVSIGYSMDDSYLLIYLSTNK